MPDLKFGRRKPDPQHALRAILFKDILKAVPVHPVSVDYLTVLSHWKMLGNDTYGDCVAVAWANSRRFFSAELARKEYYPTQQQVFDVYRTQNPNFPNQDDGMDFQTLLEYLNKTGGPDGVKCLAFAKVDQTNLEEVKAALYIFGGILLGMDVQQENIDDFNAGAVWTYHTKGTLAGGHGVLAGGYLGQLSNDVHCITWGEETGLTDSFWSHLVSNADGECWVVIWPENLGTQQFVDGIDYAALAKAYNELTGRVLPPAPNPTPAPPPVPTPQPPPANVPQWLIDLLNELLTIKGLPKWVVSVIKAILVSVGG